MEVAEARVAYLLQAQAGRQDTTFPALDVAGINLMKKTLVLGECKWSPHLMGRSVLQELVDKTPEIVPGEGQWRVHYLGFARGGWTREAQQFAAQLAEAGPAGSNWRMIGMKVLDLEQVDRDLAKWTI